MLALGSRLLMAGGLASSEADARDQLIRVRDDGSALACWGRSIEAMGGDPAVIEDPEHVLGVAPVVRAMKADRSGTLTGYDVRALGMAVVSLGGGRTAPDAAIDGRVGLTEIPLVGQFFDPQDDFMVIHASSEEQWQMAADRVRRSLNWDEEGWQTPPVVHAHLT